MTNLQHPSPIVDEVAERRAALLTIMRDAVAETAKRPPGRRGPYVFDEAELQTLADEFASLVSPPKAGAGEPVAWRWRGPRGGWITDEVKPKWPSEPLYAAPNHEARGDGVRVTDAQVEAACHAHAPQWDGIDPEIQVYARQQMRAALEAALPPLGDGSAEIVEACARAADEAADKINRERDELLVAAKRASSILRDRGVPGWGVAKDILNEAIAKADSRAISLNHGKAR